MRNALRLGITLGDINGIGPEVSLKAVLGRRWPAGIRFVLIGSAEHTASQAAHLGFAAPPAGDPRDGKPQRHKAVCWDPAPHLRLPYRPGTVRGSAAGAALLWVKAAVAACRAGRLDGVVTAPLCKEGLHKAGLRWPGHTEYLAELVRRRRFAMMLVGGPLRVVLATRHVPLAEVARRLDQKAVTEAVRFAWEALPWLGCRKRRVAVCGLNPHAGDGGLIGREEIEIIRPALARLRRHGIRADGPVPADTVFHYAARGEYDVVVAMYHDQGLAPLKMAAFERGVNLTLGLPLVRTSPDHGTAFDIAGRGEADPSSMAEAIRLAARLIRRKNPWA